MAQNAWEGKRVRLRAIEPQDWIMYYEWNKDTDVSRAFDAMQFPSSAESVRKWVQEESTRKPDNDHFHFQIEALSGEAVGMISSHTCDPRCGTFAYGIGIIAEHQRKGYASDAILILLRHFFCERRYQKVSPIAFSFNEASIQLHDRLGFVREGRIRRTKYTNGQYYDTICFGMTVEEFREKHPDFWK